MINMGLRLATDNDLKEITNLYKITIKYKFFNIPRIYINRMIQRKQVIIFGYDNKILGCYIWKINKLLHPNIIKRGKDNVAWLEQIMVYPEHQREGIGNILMEHYLSHNVKVFRLICKEQLIDYYKRYEFTVVETIISDKQQKVIMTKTTKSI